MDLTTLMTGITPDAGYTGKTGADDMVLAVNLAETPAMDPSGYIVADEGITEQSGALTGKTSDKTYLRKGPVTVKSSTSRTFNVTGDRMVGDAFQDALLAHKMKYGKGSKVIKDYVYFNILTGKGEKGQVSIVIGDDLGGAPGEDATFSATLTSYGEPEEYTYTAGT